MIHAQMPADPVPPMPGGPIGPDPDGPGPGGPEPLGDPPGPLPVPPDPGPPPMTMLRAVIAIGFASLLTACAAARPDPLVSPQLGSGVTSSNGGGTRSVGQPPVRSPGSF